MKITIETIDHKDQRYPTCGDWVFIGDEIHIRVSKLSDWRDEALIAVHELVEAILCKDAGITQEMVDNFDKNFEEARHPDNEGEPGDDPTAPYRSQHCFATGIERLIAAELGVGWKEYEDELRAL